MNSLKLKPKLKILSLVVLVMCCSIVFVYSAHAGSDEYDLGFDEDTEITWECTRVNEEKLEEFLDAYEVDYLALDFDYDEGDKVTYKLTSIDDEDDYYRLYFDVYENDEREREGIAHAKIAKDPDDLAADMFDDPTVTLESGFTYDFLFILTKSRDYIQEFGAAIPALYNLFVKVSYRSIIIDSTVLGLGDIVVLTYDDDGILEEFKVYYQNYLILVIELDSVSKSVPNIFPLLIIGIIIPLIAALLGVAIFLIIKHTKKESIEARTEELRKEDISHIPKETITPPIADQIGFGSKKPLYCELCGANRKPNANFCIKCGNKFL